MGKANSTKRSGQQQHTNHNGFAVLPPAQMPLRGRQLQRVQGNRHMRQLLHRNLLQNTPVAGDKRPHFPSCHLALNDALLQPSFETSPTTAHGSNCLKLSGGAAAETSSTFDSTERGQTMSTPPRQTSSCRTFARWWETLAPGATQTPHGERSVGCVYI